MRRRADWRMYDFNGRIRAEVRNVDVAQAAAAFLALKQACFGTGAAIPYPTVAVRRRRGERRWARLDSSQGRRFWSHTRRNDED